MTRSLFGHDKDVSSLAGISDVIISPKVEKLLGNMAEESVVKDMGGVLANPPAQKYVNDIGQKLAKLSKRADYGYKFGIVKTDKPNAFALPNGSVYVTQGLIRLLRNEAQLANVLGHEVSHVTERHTADQLVVNMGTLGFLELANALLKGDPSSKERQATKEMVFSLISNGYSRDNEREADKVGHKLAATAGWDPSGMIDVMAIFQSLEKDHPKGVEDYTRSHPYADERLKVASERAKTLQRGELGQERYEAFLADIMGIPKKEVAKPPTQAADSFLPGTPPVQAAPAGMMPSWLIPVGVIAVAGGAMLFLLPKIMKR